jgi:hypothetical protein
MKSSMKESIIWENIDKKNVNHKYPTLGELYVGKWISISLATYWYVKACYLLLSLCTFDWVFII